MADFDLIIRGGMVFDGSGAAPVTADVGIRDGKVATVAAGLTGGIRTMDGHDKWVMPGLLDVHTHYYAEVLINPGLGESVRHGTTSIVLGNCSLSTAVKKFWTDFSDRPMSRSASPIPAHTCAIWRFTTLESACSNVSTGVDPCTSKLPCTG